MGTTPLAGNMHFIIAALQGGVYTPGKEKLIRMLLSGHDAPQGATVLRHDEAPCRAWQPQA